MQRMHGVDALGIYSQTPTSPFATLKVGIYQPVDPRAAPSAADLRGFVEEQVRRFGHGTFDMRILRVPFDLHHPMWVVDPDYSPEDHIYHAALPAPGDKAQLCEFLSDLMGRPLDPDRPLWEIWVVEGLEEGRLAVALKLHHSLADGGTIARVMEMSHSPDEDGASTSGAMGDALPGAARLVVGALADLVRSVTGELPDFLRERRQARQEQSDDPDGADSNGELSSEAGMAWHAPFTVLNEKQGGRYRVYRYETFPLAEVKAMAKTFGCTINTLVLGIASEALKRYLTEVDEVPPSSLLAAMPVGSPGRAPHATSLHPTPPRNDVAVAVLPLHQEIEDFAQRLVMIKDSSAAAIDRVVRAWGRRFDNFLEFLPGTVVRHVMIDVMGRQQAKRKGAFANVVISNVAGPREPLFALDDRLELVDVLSTGNITDAGNLNITVWSYVDHLNVSFYMRKGGMPEPDRLPAHVRDVFEELRLGLRAEEAEPPQADEPAMSR